MGRTFNMIGGGGGADSGAYVGIIPPAAQLGKNGDYYFELAGYHRSFNKSVSISASSAIGGFEFTVNSDIQLRGVTALARQTYSGEIKIGKDDGTVLKTVSIDLVAGTWVSVIFDEPMPLTTGVNYVVVLEGTSNTLYYVMGVNSSDFVDSRVQYVMGRYGGFPGYNESGTLYTVDILIAETAEPYSVSESYYKSNGVWGQYWPR